MDDALEQLHFVIALGQPHEGIQLVGDVVYYVVLLFVFRVATTAAGGRLEGRAHGGGGHVDARHAEMSRWTTPHFFLLSADELQAQWAGAPGDLDLRARVRLPPRLALDGEVPA